MVSADPLLRGFLLLSRFFFASLIRFARTYHVNIPRLLRVVFGLRDPREAMHRSRRKRSHLSCKPSEYARTGGVNI